MADGLDFGRLHTIVPAFRVWLGLLGFSHFGV